MPQVTKFEQVQGLEPRGGGAGVHVKKFQQVHSRNMGTSSCEQTDSLTDKLKTLTSRNFVDISPTQSPSINPVSTHY